MNIDAAELSGRKAYKLMISLLVPRPIAWVGTRSADGRNNLAPFSYFMGVSSRPPILAFSVARADREGALKDTARNILDTEVMTVSIVSEHLLDPMHRSSSRFPPEVDEFAETGMTAVDGERVAAPYPAQAGVSMECRLHQAIDLGSTHLFLAEVLRYHIDDALLNEDGLVDELKLRPVARLGPAGYAGLGSILAPGTEGR